MGEFLTVSTVPFEDCILSWATWVAVNESVHNALAVTLAVVAARNSNARDPDSACRSHTITFGYFWGDELDVPIRSNVPGTNIRVIHEVHVVEDNIVQIKMCAYKVYVMR